MLQIVSNDLILQILDNASSRTSLRLWNLTRPIMEHVWRRKEAAPKLKPKKNNNEIEKGKFSKTRLFNSIFRTYWPTSRKLQIFLNFFSEELLDHIITETIRYSIHQTGSSSGITKVDLKRFLGICILSSIVEIPNTRCFWRPTLGNVIVQNLMTVNEFERIKRFLHFNNNDEQKSQDEDGCDRLFKLRPVMKTLLTNFQKVPFEESLLLDEQVCITKYRSYLKQYIPRKPHKWGFKLFVLCGISGYVYDFEIYTGEQLPQLPGDIISVLYKRCQHIYLLEPPEKVVH